MDRDQADYKRKSRIRESMRKSEEIESRSKEKKKNNKKELIGMVGMQWGSGTHHPSYKERIKNK